MFYVLVFKSFELSEGTFVSASQPPYSPDVHLSDFLTFAKRREHVSEIQTKPMNELKFFSKKLQLRSNVKSVTKKSTDVGSVSIHTFYFT